MEKAENIKYSRVPQDEDGNVIRRKNEDKGDAMEGNKKRGCHIKEQSSD